MVITMGYPVNANGVTNAYFSFLQEKSAMIKKIQIANYKSIDKLKFELGRINVLIGENGAGKSNVLEAIVLAGAAAAGKLDNEFLTSRGIRVTRSEYMRPAFPGFNSLESVFLTVESEDRIALFELLNENKLYSKWQARTPKNLGIDKNKKLLQEYREIIIESPKEEGAEEMAQYAVAGVDSILEQINRLQNTVSELLQLDTERVLSIQRKITEAIDELVFQADKSLYTFKKRTVFYNIVNNFLIYSPENSALRTFQREGQIEPLGINGEGLLKLLSVLSRPEYSEALDEIKASLQVLGWFEDLRLTETDPFAGSRIEIKDRYLDETRRYYDQLSTNEGFLFLLFYFALFSSDLTPKFFAIDNIDASLNPKLCEKLMRELVKLAEKHDKQVILTTHNPAILDGLNLDDDEQRLFVVSRNKNGATRMKRVNKPTTPTGERPVRLSELFLRGVLGGLPKGF